MADGCANFDDVNKVFKAMQDGAKFVDEGHAMEKDRITAEFAKLKEMYTDEIKKVKLQWLNESLRNQSQ